MELLTGREFENRLVQLCSEHNLLSYRLWIQTNNVVRGTSPYHSNLHMDGMALLSHELLMQTNPDADKDSVFCLLAATLIHDMDHTLGEYSDNVNIQNAISAFRDWVWAQPAESDFKRLQARIENLIYMTEFPYVSERTPVDVCEKVIRDADILWGVMPGRAVVIVEGLRNELINKFPQYADETKLVSFVYDRIDFLRACEFFTHAGKSYFDKNILQHKIELLDYVNAR